MREPCHTGTARNRKSTNTIINKQTAPKVMKTTIKTLAAALALLAAPLAAQAQKRLVLMEEFTNTGCAPCAEFAPALDSLLKARINDVVAVKYHFNFPQRNDPYYLANAGDIDKRGAYYGITGVPSVIINGKQQYAIASMLDGYIDQAMTAEKLINMSVNATLTPPSGHWRAGHPGKRHHRARPAPLCGRCGRATHL